MGFPSLIFNLCLEAEGLDVELEELGPGFAVGGASLPLSFLDGSWRHRSKQLLFGQGEHAATAMKTGFLDPGNRRVSARNRRTQMSSVGSAMLVVYSSRGCGGRERDLPMESLNSDRKVL